MKPKQGNKAGKQSRETKGRNKARKQNKETKQGNKGGNKGGNQKGETKLGKQIILFQGRGGEGEGDIIAGRRGLLLRRDIILGVLDGGFEKQGNKGGKQS